MKREAAGYTRWTLLPPCRQRNEHGPGAQQCKICRAVWVLARWATKICCSRLQRPRKISGCHSHPKLVVPRCSPWVWVGGFLSEVGVTRDSRRVSCQKKPTYPLYWQLGEWGESGAYLSRNLQSGARAQGWVGPLRAKWLSRTILLPTGCMNAWIGPPVRVPTGAQI